MKQFFIFYLLAISALAQPPGLSVTGRVAGYIANRIGDYDGLRLQPDTGNPLAIQFPPHAASQIMKLGPVGQRVDAELRPPRSWHEDNAPERGRGGRHDRPNPYRLMRLSQPTTGLTLDLREVPPPTPRAGTLVQGVGNLTGGITDDRGRLVGLLIDKTYLLELRPHQTDLLQTLLSTGQRVGFSGYQRSADGFVNQTGRAVIRPLSLTIDNKTYAF